MEKTLNSRGAAGWLILLLSLALPGLLFFNWWSRMDKRQKKELQLTVRKRTADLPFSGSTNRNKLSNPVAGAPDSMPPAAVAGALAEAAPGATAQSPLPQAVPLDAAAGFPARDPMLSPYDLVRIENNRVAALAAAQALVDARNPRPRRKKHAPPEPSIEDTIELQGIVSNAENKNKAIVNGEVVSEGDLVGKARILKISTQAVVFIYKNKRFTKSINK